MQNSNSLNILPAYKNYDNILMKDSFSQQGLLWEFVILVVLQ